MENLWTIKTWCSSPEMLKQGKSSAAVIVIWHIRDKAMMERKTRYEGACCRIWNRWQYEIYWRRFRTGIVTKSKERGTSREIGIWWSCYKKHLIKFAQGRRVEVEWLRWRLTIIENKEAHWQFLSDVIKGSFWDMQTMAGTWKASGSSGLV